MGKLEQYDTVADRKGLGERWNVYRVRRRLRHTEWLVVPYMMIAVVAYVLLETPLLYVPVLAAIAVGIFVGLRRIPPRTGIRLILVYENGLLFVHTNAYPVTLLWEDVEASRQVYEQSDVKFRSGGIESTTKYGHLTIWPSDGKPPIVLMHVLRQSELASTIEEEIRPRLFESLNAALDANGEVPVGPVAVTRTGIRFPAADKDRPPVLLDWSQLKETRISPTSDVLLRFQRQTGAPKGPSSFVVSVPNAAVFRDFIEETRGLAE
ncbi:MULTISPECIES: DUF6585 family protein [Streptomyces]|uniref:DUF6585 family protein n=1 Tax=Streptomyces TaxID=1883 RepID=UPI00069BEF27|nr:MULTISPECIES: DUF6585 family protein [Streptomyces]MYU57341.1 hypothetical protein [Streptomyces sp. SID7805]